MAKIPYMACSRRYQNKSATGKDNDAGRDAEGKGTGCKQINSDIDKTNDRREFSTLLSVWRALDTYNLGESCQCIDMQRERRRD